MRRPRETTWSRFIFSGFATREGLWKTYSWARTALELCLDTPRKQRAVELFENDVCDFGVDILCVEEQTVHVEQASANGREGSEIHELSVSYVTTLYGVKLTFCWWPYCE